MWNEIYDFFEKFTGITYDFSHDLNMLTDELPFIEPYEWQTRVTFILSNLSEALDCIDEHGDELLDTLPGKIDVKKIVASFVLNGLVTKINKIKKTLNIDIDDITSYDDLTYQIYVIGEFLNMLVNNSLDEILGKDLFNTYMDDDADDDDEFENPFIETLGLHENDVPSLSMTVQSIREDYYASLEEE